MKKTYTGSCHCGAVRFEADIDLAQGTFKCNCSICYKARAWMAGIPAEAFRLLSGETSLRDYQFGKKAIHHMFCGRCGVRSFSRGSDGKGNQFYAIRVNCLDGVEPRDAADAPVRFFDMQHDLMSAPAETRHL
ncbi:MAG: GFA family protein [Betaproteobacteria bacterium]